MRLYIFVFLMIFCAAVLFSAPGGTVPAHAAPVMTVPGAERPIELRALDIEAGIAGRFAWTTAEMTFYNPNGRVLEGELDFPLENGQRVTGFALSMGEGKQEVMRDAVPVEKGAGRQAFEEIVRQNVDPALLEVTQGNNFKLRVYPLPPGGTRRVRVSYSEPLTEIGGELKYRLPMAGYDGRIGKFGLRVTAAGGGRPALSGNLAENLPVKITVDEESGVFEMTASAENAVFGGGGLDVTIAAPGDDEVYFGKRGGRTYFYAQIPRPDRDRPAVGPKTVSSLSILWDASASGRARDHAREFDFLAEFFKNNRDLTVKLQIVRDAAGEESEFNVADGDWSPLRSSLESAVYDGATNLGAFRTDVPSDMYMLFSDGLDNYSENPLEVPKQPMFAFVSSPGSDSARLRNLSSRSGGAVIDLSLSDARSALETVMHPRARISAITGEGVSDIQWAGGAGSDGFAVTGVMDGVSGSIRVVFETPLKETLGRDVVLRQKRGEGGGDVHSGSIPILWASMKLESLDAEYNLNRGEIRRLGKSFGLATRETSLIVLDSAADYARYGIDPPADLRDEYDKLLPGGMTSNTGESGKLDRVLEEWRQREEWWKKDFPKDGYKLSKEEAKPNSARRLPAEDREM